MEQVLVGIVDLDHVKASLNGALCSSDESLCDALDLLQGQGFRIRVSQTSSDCRGSMHIIGPATDLIGGKVSAYPRSYD